MDEKKKSENSNLVHPRRIQVFLVGDILGFAIFVIGIKPELFGLNRSPVIGSRPKLNLLVQGYPRRFG